MRRNPRRAPVREVDTWQGPKGFDEARYYEGQNFELGGVDFGYDSPENDQSYDYWDEGAGTGNPRAQKKMHTRGWDRPGRRSSDYGTTREGKERFRTDTGKGNHPYNYRNHSGKGPKGYSRSDESIHDEVCEVLYQNPDVDASAMEVLVKDRHVTLSGEVNSRQEKRLAEECLDHIRGIVDVTNELKIHKSPKDRMDMGPRKLEDLERFRIA